MQMVKHADCKSATKIRSEFESRVAHGDRSSTVDSQVVILEDAGSNPVDHPDTKSSRAAWVMSGSSFGRAEFAQYTARLTARHWALNPVIEVRILGGVQNSRTPLLVQLERTGEAAPTGSCPIKRRVGTPHGIHADMVRHLASTQEQTEFESRVSLNTCPRGVNLPLWPWASVCRLEDL